jgi:purine-cytosine permease-like protein
MPDTNDPDPLSADAAWAACLERTRSAVLNVLVGVGLTIAMGGWLLRGRAEAGPLPKPQRLHEVLLAALIVLVVASYLVRRRARRRVAATDPSHRQAAFYRSHVLAATIAALAAPLGIVYGWWIDPRLSAVIPFWVVPLALGFQSIPRARELDDFDRSSTNPGASPP